MQALQGVCEQSTVARSARNSPLDYNLHTRMQPASLQGTGAMQTPEKSFTDTLTPKTQAKSSAMLHQTVFRVAGFANAPAGVSPPALFLPTAQSYQNELGAGKRVTARSPPRDPRLQKKPRHAADDGEKHERAAMSLQGVDLHGVVIKKPHYCGVQILGYKVLEIQRTEENKYKYVRQWTKDCSNEPKPLVFDVHGKPLANPADARGAVNVIDALKALGKNERFARDLANKDRLVELVGWDNVFMISWDGNPRVRY